ncbi:hypothetical protein BDW69DRAFT_185644 [Aspergillus filifer]
MNTRQSKRAGRPLLDPNNDSTLCLSRDRRAQVRRAQRTYREKKEAVFKDATARADKLEVKLETVNKALLELSETAEDVELHLSHPDIYDGLVQLRQLLSDGQECKKTGSSEEQTAELDPVSNTLELPQAGNIPPCRPPPSIQTRAYTYAFHESTFTRQLHRYCLEHAYCLFTDNRSNPHEIYRVFRLVACIKDPSKTEPRFRQLLMGGRTDTLELLGLPFYCIGGASTHYPQRDEEENVIYPVNSHLPRRILGIVSRAEEERAKALADYGFGGEWFDCRDVEGYLREQGFNLTGALFPALHIPSRAGEDNGRHSIVLDIEQFFQRLLSTFAILGRAPGFRKADVRCALQTSVKKSLKNL